jgi:hypothetical protein
MTMETTTDARSAAMKWYEDGFERIAIDEQIARGSGDGPEAERLHFLGLVALRARMAEEGDPTPKESYPHCLDCAFYLRRTKGG